LAGLPKDLIETPAPPAAGALRAPGAGDVLSEVLRTIRLTGSLQFCFMPSGAWQTDDKPALGKSAGSSGVMPFHIVVEGACWLKLDGRTTELVAGDVVAFPFGTGHQLGSGSNGRLVIPTEELPPKPWRELPVLRHGEGPVSVRLLCGYVRCDGMNFQPLRSALPALLHVRTAASAEARWLRATIDQIVAEVDAPRTGGLSMLERLTEIIFIELLRHHIMTASAGSAGWLAALADPALGRCLALIHEDPRRDWTAPELAAAAGLSRSSLAERFETVLDTSPIRYVRDWRLYLAGVALATGARPIAAIAEEAGYGTEAAFSRAFSRAYGTPPAAWRQSRRAAS
jgi:AraC-like DNA-binding protein